MTIRNYLNLAPLLLAAVLVNGVAMTAFADSSSTQGGPDDRLTLFNLNIGHGRGDSISQVFLGTSTISQNLSRIGDLLEAHAADVVALQEADHPSLWSGNIDHVEWLANRASYLDVAHSSHASSVLFDFGTAILSRFPIEETIHHTFEPSPPTLRKGFTLVRIRWIRTSDSGDQQQPVEFDVVSVHLDFSRASVRAGQVEELIGVLKGRSYPLIIMGDLNTDLLGGEFLLNDLAEALGLRLYRPDANDLGTYPKNGRRLDWILVSKEFEFVEYNVLPEPVSDHLALVAVVALRTSAD